VSFGGSSPARFALFAKNPPMDETIHKKLAASYPPSRPTNTGVVGAWRCGWRIGIPAGLAFLSLGY
jgi:hypothetical protein